MRKQKALFLRTQNSARSQMAEALLLGGSPLEVTPCGFAELTFHALG
jgi:protein-tyrosine-phosphatase